MRSTLKKSLYLGLAALSFASVAGAANNADAAKKTKPAKNYATASYQPIADQGQNNIAYNVTGSNALFNKPGTVKGAKQTVSKATMSDLASSKQNFMVYQTATTNRGSKYIKVVSFDKQYRGWIYAGNNTSSGYGTGVQRVNLTTNASPQYSAVYLSNPGQTALKNSPEGAQFNDSQNSFGHTGFVANDKFTVDGAQTVNRTGTTWYHLTNQNDSTINGWVPSTQVQPTSADYFNNRTDVKVNYTNQTGQVVKSSNVNVSSLGNRNNYSNVLDPNGLANVINSDSTSSLKNMSYNLTNNSYMTGTSGVNGGPVFNTDNSNLSNVSPSLQYVTTGSTITVPVTSTTNGKDTASGFNFHVTNGVTGASSLSTDSFNNVTIDSSSLSNQVNGYSPLQTVDMNAVIGNYNGSTTTLPDAKTDISNSKLFNPSQSNNLGVLYGSSIQTAPYNMNNVSAVAASNSGNDGNTNVKNNAFGDLNSQKTDTINYGDKFHYDYVLDVATTKSANANKSYGQNIDLYYTQVPVKDNTNTSQKVF